MTVGNRNEGKSEKFEPVLGFRIAEKITADARPGVVTCIGNDPLLFNARFRDAPHIQVGLYLSRLGKNFLNFTMRHSAKNFHHTKDYFKLSKI